MRMERWLLTWTFQFKADPRQPGAVSQTAPAFAGEAGLATFLDTTMTDLRKCSGETRGAKLIRGPQHYDALSRLAMVLGIAEAVEFQDKSTEWLLLAYHWAAQGHTMQDLEALVSREIEARRAGIA